MTLGGQNAGICLIEITVADRAFAIVRRERLPQFATDLAAAITKGQTNNPACLLLQGNLDPDFVVFAGDERPQFVAFQKRSLAQRFGGLTDRCQDFFSGLQQRSCCPSRLYGQSHAARAVRAPTFRRWHVCRHILGLWCRVCRRRCTLYNGTSVDRSRCDHFLRKLTEPQRRQVMVIMRTLVSLFENVHMMPYISRYKTTTHLSRRVRSRDGRAGACLWRHRYRRGGCSGGVCRGSAALACGRAAAKPGWLAHHHRSQPRD